MAKQQVPRNLTDPVIEMANLVADPFSKISDQILAKTARRYDLLLYRFLTTAGLFPIQTSEVWADLLRIRFLRLVCSENAETATRIQALLSKKRPKPKIPQLEVEVYRGFFINLDDSSTPDSVGSPKDTWQTAFDSVSADLTKKGKKRFVPTHTDFELMGSAFTPPYFDIYSAADLRPEPRT
jgi:hypothetical protein